jgi:predicted PurR-regulated permease PerM
MGTGLNNVNNANFEKKDRETVRKARHEGVIESCMVLMAVLAAGLVLSKSAQIAIPFILALLLSLLFAPMVTEGKKYGLPAPLAVLIILAGLTVICLPLAILVHYRLQGMISLLPGYYAKLVEISQTLLMSLNFPKSFWASVNCQNTLGGYLTGMTGYLFKALTNIVMVIVFMVFMLMESPYAEKRLKLAFRGERGEAITQIARKIIRQISKYLRTLAVISAATGFCVWLAMRMIGVDFAMTWGMLAFFLNFIPTIGSIAASIPPILIALVQYYPDWLPCALTFASLLCVQFTIGNILTPKIMGDTLGLSPVVILISLFFWGMVWGIAGALLSVPIAAMIKIVCENVPRFRFIAVLMSSAKGRSAPGEEKA